jgi:hypothetical protein
MAVLRNLVRRNPMKRIAFILVAVAALAGGLA